MIDVSSKSNSLRHARAEGYLSGRPETFRRVAAGTVPKGDVAQVARAAGIMAAKRCSEWIVFCHPIPLDWVEVAVEPAGDRLKVSAQVRSVWKTGVEVEAVAAVTGALLNAYDMLKPLDDSLLIGDIRVVEKKGGKGDFAEMLPAPVRTAVLVISDSTHAGARRDTVGGVIRDFLADKEVEIAVSEVLPDDRQIISRRLRELADQEGMRLVLTAGGTGLSPRDVTPEASREVIERSVPGIAETIRRYGRDRTPRAMLSRGEAGVRGDCLIINLPGSSKGALESLQALFPGLLHIFPMLEGGGH